MNEPGKEQIEAAIAEYREPYLDMDLVSAKAIKSIDVESGMIRIAVELATDAAHGWNACKPLAKALYTPTFMIDSN
jgi:hypothetical protein